MKGLDDLTATTPSGAHDAVIVHIPRIDFDQSVPLEDELTEVMESTDFGYRDGNEIGGGETTLWIFGKSAEEVFQTIEPILRSNQFCEGAKIVLRYGKPGSRERTFDL